MGFSYSNWPQNWAQQTRHRSYRQEEKELHNNKYRLPIWPRSKSLKNKKKNKKTLKSTRLKTIAEVPVEL